MAHFGVRMDHVVGPRNSRDLNASAHRRLTDTGYERGCDVIWECWKTSTAHIELDASQPMLSHGVEHALHHWTVKRLGEDSQSHHTPPVTSANDIHAPVSTEREIATRVRMAATPSSIPAPYRGAPCRIVSAKPSICSL